MKKTIITILLASASVIGFAQKKAKPEFSSDTVPVPKDSVAAIMDTPLLSINDMEKLNVVIMKQFDLTEQGKYQTILKEIQSLITEGQKRKKTPQK